MKLNEVQSAIGVAKYRVNPIPFRVQCLPGFRIEQLLAFYFPGRMELWDERCAAAFLGNFYDCAPEKLSVKIGQGSFQFSNAEAAFHALKFPNCREAFEDLTGQEAFHLKCKLAGNEDTTFSGYQNRFQAMKAVLSAKFRPGSDMARRLLDTGHAFLSEHNNRAGKDSFWSDNCDGTGKNLLGLLLMLKRDELKGHNCWRRWLSNQNVDLFTGEVAPISLWQCLVHRATDCLLDAMPQLVRAYMAASSSYPAVSSQPAPRLILLAENSKAHPSACLVERRSLRDVDDNSQQSGKNNSHEIRFLTFDSYINRNNCKLVVFSNLGENGQSECGAYFLSNLFCINPVFGNLEVVHRKNGTKCTFRNAVAAYLAMRFWPERHSFKCLDGLEAIERSKSCQKSMGGDILESGYPDPWQAQLAVLRGKFRVEYMAKALLNTQDAFLLNVSSNSLLPWFEAHNPRMPNVLGLQLMCVRDELLQQGGVTSTRNQWKDVVNKIQNGDNKWQADVDAANRAWMMHCSKSGPKFISRH